jgi:hypothetical protein
MPAATSIAIAAVAVSTAVTLKAQHDAAKQADKAADAEKEANATAAAEQKGQQREKTRAQVREARVRRAAILQASENTGVAASSGEAGAVGATGTILGASVASSARSTQAANGITNSLQQAADYREKGQKILDRAQTINSAINMGSGAYGAYKSPSATPPQGEMVGPPEQSNMDKFSNLFK